MNGRFWFCLTMILIALSIMWPGYTLFSSATPLIFGFPLSFAWIIFCTIAGFIALMALYLYDNRNEEAD
ncbi:MAG: hypothetical protein JJU37_12395 [Balneolaceae bacterium]|nr:hypothetical protein [Balneolaceae bacterium]